MNGLDKTIFILLYPILLVDAVNGYLIRNYPTNISLSQTYKLILTLLLVTVALRDKKFAPYFIFLSGSFSLISLYHLFYIKKSIHLFNDIIIISKIIFPLLIFIFIKNCFSNYNHKTIFTHVKYIFSFSYLVVIANILLGIFGLGYRITESYGGLGNVGFFDSANALSSVFLLISAFLFYILPRNVIFYISFGAITMFFAVALETKTAIISAIVLVSIIPILKKPAFANFTKRLFVQSIVLAALSYGVFHIITALDLALLRKFTYIYEKHGLASAILTGRNYFLTLGLKLLEYKFSFADWLLGRGYITVQKEIRAFYSEDKIMEMDLFDILLSYGIVGVLLSYSIWGLFIYNTVKRFHAHVLIRFIFFINVMLLIISFVSGHIMFAGLTTTFIGMINGLIFFVDQNTAVYATPENENTSNKQLPLHTRRQR